MRRLSEALYLFAITLWIGGLWVIGYLVAPVLFANLGDRQLAGMVAGKLFALIGWIGLGAAAYLCAFLLARYGLRALRATGLWLVLLMAALAAAQLFGIQPLMEQLKLAAVAQEAMASVTRDRFATWHGISSIVYLIQSLLGLWLLLWSGRGLR